MCAAEEAKDGAAADMEEPKAAEADGAPSAAPPAEPGSNTGLFPILRRSMFPSASSDRSAFSREFRLKM